MIWRSVAMSEEYMVTPFLRLTTGANGAPLALFNNFVDGNSSGAIVVGYFTIAQVAADAAQVAADAAQVALMPLRSPRMQSGAPSIFFVPTK